MNRVKHGVNLFSDAGGDLIEVIKISAGRVHFHAQGGGLEFTTPEETFASDFNPARLTWKQVRVTGDWCDPGEFYKAWWNGERWNGWIKPYFAPDEVGRMASRSCTNLYHHVVANVPTWIAAQVDEENPDHFPLQYVDLGSAIETSVYGIGAGSWCWELAD